jgi:hypothetical protein
VKARLESMRAILFGVREKRVHPYKDDKILTDWNGLMIAAFARAARVLDDPSYAAAGRKAADFALARLRRPDGRLLHRYRDGEAAIAAHVDDYAFFIWGLIELYEATFETGYLETALTLNADQTRHYRDDVSGGYFFTADDGEELIARTKETYDGAIPSGNSIAMNNLLRLARLTGDESLTRQADGIARAFGEELGTSPSAHSMMACAVDFAVGPTREIVVSGQPAEDGARSLLAVLRGRYLPRSVVLLSPGGGAIAELAPFTRNLTAIDGNATAYVCESFSCQLPVTDPVEFGRVLDSSK